MTRKRPAYSWRLDAPSYTFRERALDAIVPDRYWRRFVRSRVEHVHGPEVVDYGTEELIVVCLLRDAEPYVEAFVEHYASLGARHVVFLDNGSTDGTVAVAREMDNVTVLRTGLPFKKYGLLMRQYLIRRFCEGRWALCVDADEFFDYPRSDLVGLNAFLRYLNDGSYTAVAAQMLDMFSDEPLSRSTASKGKLDRASHGFYDLSEVTARDYGPRWREGNVIANEGIRILRGGVRKPLFGVDPVLTKHPLVFADNEVEPMANSPHRVNNARIADLSCVLYHYKFAEDFYDRVERAVREENYHNESAEYKRYHEALKGNPSLAVKRATSRKLAGTDELVQNGFLVVSPAYTSFVEAERHGRV